MVRRYRGPQVEIDDIALNAGGKVVRVDDTHSVFLPTQIVGRITDGPYDVSFVIINVSDHPEPVIAEVTISMRHEPGAQPITPDMIRGPRLGAARRRAVELASVPLEQVGDDIFIRPGVGDAASTRAAFRKDRRNTVTLDVVRRAAEVYRTIKADPQRRDALLGVAEELTVSRATAARYVSRARALGLLEEHK